MVGGSCVYSLDNHLLTSFVYLFISFLKNDGLYIYIYIYFFFAEQILIIKKMKIKLPQQMVQSQ